MQSTLAELRNRQLFDSVRARVPPEVQAMMDDPPNPFGWIPSSQWDAILREIGEIEGRDMLREFAQVSSSGGAIAGSAVRAIFKILGTSPVSVIKKLNGVAQSLVRGMEVTYEPETKRSGVVVLRYPAPVNEFVYVSWEGAYRFVKELTREPNLVVEEAEILDGGKTGRIRIRW